MCSFFKLADGWPGHLPHSLLRVRAMTDERAVQTYPSGLNNTQQNSVARFENESSTLSKSKGPVVVSASVPTQPSQLPSHPSDMPLTSTGKRRTSSHVNIALMSQISGDGNPMKSGGGGAVEESRLAVSRRRRRFIVYSLAFAIMLAMSSMLDVRRDALRNRHAKLRLSLPSASLSSLSDPEDDSDTTTLTTVDGNAGSPTSNVGAPPTGTVPVGADNLSLPSSQQEHEYQENEKNQSPSQDQQNQRSEKQPQEERQESQSQHQSSQQQQSQDTMTSASSDITQERPVDPRHNYRLSQQELDDGVDQLIAHVDQEESAASTATNNTSLSAETNSETTSASADNRLSVDSDSPRPDQTTTGDTTTDHTNTTASEDVKLGAEDYFRGAVQRLTGLIRDETTRRLIDENDLRTLQALELQATHGDCELKSGASGGSLFKTDAEAASHIDIERTHPLWGAWCLFMGSYKTDAMRDYVTKEQVVEHKVETIRAAAGNGTTIIEPPTPPPFDPSAASLDDVMSPDQQSALRSQTEMIVSHLAANDLRYLAALSMQAAFGDCGPYGRETEPLDSHDGEEKPQLRKLREPLFEQTVMRKEGALWGAWCVMQGKKRSTAASDLSHRVELLVDQLTKSQAADQEHSPSSSTGDEADTGIGTRTLDSTLHTSQQE